MLKLSAEIKHMTCAHVHIKVFQNGGSAGVLIIERVHAEEVLRILNKRDGDEDKAAHHAVTGGIMNEH